jgi:hypothetical protein
MYRHIFITFYHLLKWTSLIFLSVWENIPLLVVIIFLSVWEYTFINHYRIILLSKREYSKSTFLVIIFISGWLYTVPWLLIIILRSIWEYNFITRYHLPFCMSIYLYYSFITHYHIPVSMRIYICYSLSSSYQYENIPLLLVIIFLSVWEYTFITRHNLPVILSVYLYTHYHLPVNMRIYRYHVITCPFPCTTKISESSKYAASIWLCAERYLVPVARGDETLIILSWIKVPPTRREYQQGNHFRFKILQCFFCTPLYVYQGN